MKILKLRHSELPPTLRLRVQAEHIVSYTDHPQGGTSLLMLGEDDPIRVLDTPDEIDAMLGLTDSTINDRMTPDSAFRVKTAARILMNAKRRADIDTYRDAVLEASEHLAPWMSNTDRRDGLAAEPAIVTARIEGDAEMRARNQFEQHPMLGAYVIRDEEGRFLHDTEWRFSEASVFDADEVGRIVRKQKRKCEQVRIR